MRNLKSKKCIVCENILKQDYVESAKSFEKRVCCSYSCARKLRPNKPWLGKKMTGNRSIGWKHSEEKNNEKSKRMKGHMVSEETKKKISEAQKGKPRLYQTGEKHHNWKGGITPENSKIRHSLEYKLWRTAVFERDNYTCTWCFRKGVILNADHVKPFAYFPELRFAIDNGRTLCVECHKSTDTYKRKFTVEITKS